MKPLNILSQKSRYINLCIGVLFKDEAKITPALKAYEKSKNIIDFRDRMRGYLGLPRRRSSVQSSMGKLFHIYGGLLNI